MAVLGQVMEALYEAKTAHGTMLVLDIAERRVAHAAAGTLGNQLVPLWLLTGGSLGRRCLPFGFEPSSGRSIIPKEISPTCGILLYALVPDELDVLRSASTHTYVAAIPGGNVDADRVTAAEWERFSLSPIFPAEGPSRLQLENFLSQAKTVLGGHASWLEKLMDVLSAPPSETNAGMVDAIWPLLSVAELDWFADHLRTTPLLAARLLELFPADFYATTAMPRLLRWLATPGQRSSKAISSAQQWRWRASGVELPSSKGLQQPSEPVVTIGPARDHLARDGYDGWIRSLAHACNSSLRAQVTPTRGTAIIAAARSEGVYLLEWISYHRAIGVEDIFLYTNNNDDGSDALLAALHQAGIIHWTRSELSNGTSAQNKAYGHAFNVSTALLDYRWALLIDLDEFLVLNPARYSSIAEFAGWHELRDTSAIGINWVMVGSSGQERWSNAPLTYRNTHLLGGANPHIKCMAAPRRFIQSHPHFPYADPRRCISFRLASGAPHEHRNQPPNAYHARAFADSPSEKDACLFHYFFKSLEEFIWKLSRNRGDMPMNSNVTFKYLDRGAIQAFLDQKIDDKIRQDNRIRQCAPRLLDDIEALRQLPNVRDAEQTIVESFSSRLNEVKTQLLDSGRLDELGEPGQELKAMLQRKGA